MTAVQWFSDKIKGMDTAVSIYRFKELLDQAKEMEKQQIIDARQSGIYATINGKSISNIDYYNETYKNTKE